MTNEKVLNFNEMEEIQGGKSDYCNTLEQWVVHDAPGFQGDWGMLLRCWHQYCEAGYLER